MESIKSLFFAISLSTSVSPALIDAAMLDRLCAASGGIAGKLMQSPIWPERM